MDWLRDPICRPIAQSRCLKAALVAVTLALGCERARVPAVEQRVAAQPATPQSATTDPLTTPPSPGTARPARATTEGPDMAAFITCQKTLADFADLGMEYYQSGKIAAWGWRALPTASMMTAFELKEPIEVFGERTSQIAFSGSGVVALLKEESLPRIVRELHLRLVTNRPTIKLYSGVLTSNGDAPTIATYISYSASVADSFPGKALVGCVYGVDVR